MRMSLPVTEWPEPDRKMLKALLQKGGPFDDRGAFADLRSSSIRLYTMCYARWLQWLCRNAPETLQDPPVSRATLARMQDWLKSLDAVAPTSRKMFFIGALQVLKAMAPDADWAAHTRQKNRLSQAAGRGDPKRKQGRILSSQVLLRGTLGYAAKSDDHALTPLARAKYQRDGAMVALLAVMPMRHYALTALRIGHSLLVTATTITVSLPRELTKNGRPWEADVPEPVATLLRRYVTEARPFLLSRSGKCHDNLWVCDNGNPMSYSYVGRKIPAITLALTGKAIPPHFFRDSAATTLTRTSPNDAKLIRPVLGHADFKTAEQHYIQSGTIEAARDYNDLIRKFRKGP
jgi:integrase/recombinase XerD